MKKDLHIGCSSYNNGLWKEIFYPAAMSRKEWFNFYCQHFDTFEINATFYKFPTLKILQNWFNKAPLDFLFSVKAPKLITHINKFVDCETEMKDFYSRCAEGLQHKLACVLFQSPPSYHYSPERLEFIISNLDLNFKNVLEFRHEPENKKISNGKKVPWPVKKGGLALLVYKYSLSIALLVLFIISFVLHFYGSLADENKILSLKKLPLETSADYIADSRFWFESFQNWQSEFLSVFAIVILSIYLRQQGSPQSKTIYEPDSKTGE